MPVLVWPGRGSKIEAIPLKQRNKSGLSFVIESVNALFRSNIYFCPHLIIYLIKKKLNMINKILFVGGGAIATALGNVLAQKPELDVTMITVEAEVAESVNNEHVNPKYFPNIKLNANLKASTDFSLLIEEAFVFIAIPSVITVDFISNQLIHKNSILINLAKGFGNERRTIVECLHQKISNPVCTMKGPSFAREILNSQYTGFTIGAADKMVYDSLKQLFASTSIYVDYSSDVRGIEMLSILKNIYAIVVGIIDAQYESPNLKFMVFTKAFEEMRSLLILFGGSKKTIFKYCGIGDFALTALNDLSRNRTLGLLIGKGFFTDYISEKVVLEGRIAVNVFHEELESMEVKTSDYPILNELYLVFNTEYDISKFVGKLLS
jgi:glycerol-3-phosphate dehydrogenase (NAD(P)+)